MATLEKTRVHPMAFIADTGTKPVTKDERANAAVVSDEATGEQLAASAINELQGQGRVWLTYVARLYVLTPKAREAFSKFIAKHVRDMAAHVKRAEESGNPDHVRMKKAGASARTKLSELRTIARALNAGMELEVMREGAEVYRDKNGNAVPAQPFYTIVADARMFLEAQAEGNAAKRGRKADSFVDKLKKFMERNAASLKDRKDAAEFCAAYVKTKKDDKPEDKPATM